MKKIKLLRIEIENFKCFKHKVIDFSTKTWIKGRNAVGKTTIFNAVLWLLFDKDLNGNSASDIRPHDENGVEIDNIDISVAATFDVDGKIITLKKIQKQNWVKKRGSDAQTFQGNINEFSVNDIPKKQADYKKYVDENFCPEDVFLSCSNAQSFFKLDTKKRRSKIMQFVKEFTDADVIAKNESFKPLAGALEDGTVGELIARSKTAIKKLNEALKMIPARIDEQEKSKVDIDVAELELSRNALLDKVKDIEEKESDLEKQLEEYNKSSDGIMEIKFSMNDMVRKASEGYARQKSGLESKAMMNQIEISGIKECINKNKSLIDSFMRGIEILKSEKKQLSNEWKRINESVFDESALVCALCGQSYPQEKQDSLRTEFDTRKKEKLSNIVANGNTLKEQIQKETDKINGLQKDIEEKKSKLSTLESELEQFNNQLAELQQPEDVTQTEEYKELEKQLAEKEGFLASFSSAEEFKNQLKYEKSQVIGEIREIDSKIAVSQRNVDIDERISELQAEQRETAQKIVDEEKMLDLLEQFNRTKMNMLTETVNKHFSIVQFKLFEEQINGGYADCCKVLVGGSDYERGLNDGDCLLANVDLLQTFQRMSDVQLPIFLDRAESINADRIPDIEGQLICLSVSDDKEMVVV